MDNVTYLPQPEDLERVYIQAAEGEDKQKIFTEIAKRVIEHSNEIKRLIHIQGDING